MRIPGILALCLASAFSLTAAGQSTPTAATGQSARSRNSSAPPVAQNTSKASPQTAAQPESSGPGAQPQGPSQQPQLQTGLPQMPFDRGIYVGRNSVAGDNVCLAIQSYNFSQGNSPKLESVTTCTTLRRPVMRHVHKPGNPDQQGQGTEQQKDNDQK